MYKIGKESKMTRVTLILFDTKKFICPKLYGRQKQVKFRANERNTDELIVSDVHGLS